MDIGVNVMVSAAFDSLSAVGDVAWLRLWIAWYDVTASQSEELSLRHRLRRVSVNIHSTSVGGGVCAGCAASASTLIRLVWVGVCV